MKFVAMLVRIIQDSIVCTGRSRAFSKYSSLTLIYIQLLGLVTSIKETQGRLVLWGYVEHEVHIFSICT